MSKTEAEEQKEVVAWFRETWPEYEKCIRLSLNGVNLGGGTKAARMINSMKAQGMTVDESDLVFLVPKSQYHGLCIEMKAMKKKPTAGQLEYLVLMNELGYMAAWCEGAEEAKDLITIYMMVNS